MSGTTQRVLAVVLPVVIVAAIVLGIIWMTPPKAREKSEYEYTQYAIDDDGNIYYFQVPGPGLTWPVMHEGKELKPLYVCSDCGNKFAGNIGAMTTSCPVCGGPNVGAYVGKPEDIGAKEIQVEITKP